MQSIALVTNSFEPTEWEDSVRAALSAGGQTISIWSTNTDVQISASPHSEIELLIDLSECGAGIELAERTGLPVWLLCHGTEIRMDLCNSIKSGFVRREPFIEVRLVEWRAETKSAQTIGFNRLRSRKTPGRSIAGVRVAAKDLLIDALTGIRRRSFDSEKNLQLFRGNTPTRWRLNLVTLANLVRIALDLCSVEEWNVGMASGNLEKIFNGSLMSHVDWLPPNSSLCFRADPFGWKNEEDEIVLLYEKFDFRDGKGNIVRNINGTEEVISDFPYHASYPFLLESGGQRFAVPEISELAYPMAFPVDGKSPIWEDKGAPLNGLEGVPLVDGTILSFEDRYWLFGTRSDDEPNAKLHAWHAPSSLGPWTPHKQNPIKFDITSSRPGGSAFAWQGKVIRPAQDCSTTYGAAIVLNQIDVLTPNEFKETSVGRIEPDRYSRYPDGLHTLNVIDGAIILDAKRHVLHPLAPYYRWREVFLSRSRSKAQQSEN